MSSEWRECSLGDLIEIKHGCAFPGEHISKTESKCVLVTPGNFEIGGGYKEGNAKYFHGEYPQEYVFASGDLVATMTDLSKGTSEKPDRLSSDLSLRLETDGDPPPVGFCGLRADLRQEEDAAADLP